MRSSVTFGLLVLLGLCHQCAAQDVVSASSGLLQYFEGAVIIDEKPVEHKAAVFASLKNNSTLHTNKGRAELLLTPGVFLRLDEDTSLKMESNSLTDTRVQLSGGSVILDSLNASPNSPVTLVFRGSEIRFPKAGVYRIDCDLAEMQVYTGESKVTHNGVPTLVDPSHRYYFELELTVNKFGDGDMDEFFDWAHNRSDEIADKNQMAAAEQADAQDADPAAGMFGGPPIFSLPGSSVPTPAYPSLYASSGAPFYSMQPAQNFGYLPFGTVFLYIPTHHRPDGTKWPVTTTGSVYHSLPVRWPSPVRWPAVTGSSAYTYSSLANRYSSGAIGAGVIRPGTTTRPVYSSPQHSGTSAIITSRPAAVHAVGIGHR